MYTFELNHQVQPTPKGRGHRCKDQEAGTTADTPGAAEHRGSRRLPFPTANLCDTRFSLLLPPKHIIRELMLKRIQESSCPLLGCMLRKFAEMETMLLY